MSYPSLGKKSVTSVALKELPSSFFQKLPLYGHWFAIEIYNQYLNVEEQIKNKVEEVQIWDYKFKLADLTKCSQGISKAIMAYENRGESFNHQSRGIWSSGLLRSSEVTYTAQVSHFLGAVTFPDPYAGAILHQMPTRKQPNTTGNPELADGYAALILEGELCNPCASYDVKLVDFDHSERTTVCHNVNLVRENHNYSDWPVLLGIPSTVSVMSLQVHIPVNNAMLGVPVINRKPTDLSIICTVAGSIRRLCDKEGEFCTIEAIEHMMPSPSPMRPLGKEDCEMIKECRVFVDNDKVVHKYYDTTYTQTNIEIIMKYGSLENVRLEKLTNDGRIVELRYDFIEGSHSATKLSQFIGVLRTLRKLHVAGIVHGDVRACNIIFTTDSSHLIDYDLAGTVGARYRPDYSHLRHERHAEARKGMLMRKIHDRHALAIIIGKLALDNTQFKRVCTALEDQGADLNQIIYLIQQHEF